MSDTKINGTTECLTIEQLYALLKGNIDAQDKKIFEQHIKECPLCKDALDGLANENGIKDTLETTSELKHRIESEFLIKRKKKTVYIALAASLFTILVIWIISGIMSADLSVFDTYFEPYSNIIPVKRSAPDDSLLQNAAINYEMQNYDKAVGLFNSVLKKDADNEEAHFYIAICFLIKNQARNAIPHFKFVIQKPQAHLIAPAKWYLALTYIKLNELPNALELLTELSAYKNQFAAKSQKIIKEIRKTDG